MAASVIVFPFFFVLYAAIYSSYRVFLGHKSITYNQFFGLISIQPFIMYAGVRFSEVGVQKLRIIWSLILSLVLTEGNNFVKDLRDDLVIKMKKYVEEYGPKLFGEEDFERIRVIKKSQMVTSERSVDSLIRIQDSLSKLLNFQ